ncbi:MAG: bifunctional folylpolyglutamate synthase/dihydrofolate synthase [Gammaproteobacteria bacterium]
MTDLQRATDREAPSFEEAVAFIMSRVRTQPRDYAARGATGLEPIESLLARLGNPHRAFKCVHIAGSKGKGSVGLYAEALFGAAGCRTGLYTSPHLRDWTERIRIDGADATRAAFATAVARTVPHVRALDELDTRSAPGFFDVLTAAAFVAFHEAGIDVAILETGLGGRLDATNAVTPMATCITSIELEHTDKLGNTLAAIAREKAGIVKPGVPLVTGPLPPEAESVIGERARALDAPRLRFGTEFGLDVRGWRDDALEIQARVEGLEIDLTLPTLGEALARNAAMALALARATALFGDEHLRLAARQLENTPLPGRIEIASRRPWIVLDGAHTSASVGALAEALNRLPVSERRAIVSVSRNRDAPRLLRPVLDGAATIYAVAADPERSMPAGALAEALRTAFPGARVEHADTVATALDQARAGLDADGLVVVTGSVYAAGAARRLLVKAL